MPVEGYFNAFCLTYPSFTNAIAVIDVLEELYVVLLRSALDRGHQLTRHGLTTLQIPHFQDRFRSGLSREFTALTECLNHCHVRERDRQ